MKGRLTKTLLGFSGGGRWLAERYWTNDSRRLVGGEVSDGDCGFVADGINDGNNVVCGVGIGSEGNRIDGWCVDSCVAVEEGDDVGCC